MVSFVFVAFTSKDYSDLQSSHQPDIMEPDPGAFVNGILWALVDVKIASPERRNTWGTRV